MYDLKIYPSCVIVGIKDRVIFLSYDGRLLHEIVISQIIPEETAKTKNGDVGNVPPPAQVVSLEYCLALKVFTISLTDKSLQSYRLTETEEGIVSEALGDRVQTARTIVCMKFAPKHGVLFGCDKSDCFEFDPFGKSDKQSKWLLGHMSLILDLAVSEDERFIVTCDRDEKIKVTSYPDCYNIACYCLGHSEYVGGMAFFSSQVLLSVSGDKTLRLWDYSSGRSIASHHLLEPAVGVTLQWLEDGSGALCAATSNSGEKINVALLNADDPAKCTLCETLSVADSIVLAAKLSSKGDLIVMALQSLTQEVQFSVYTFDSHKRRFDESVGRVLQNSLQNHFRGVKIDSVRETTTLFKNYIDNLSDYFERKRAKMDSKK